MVTAEIFACPEGIPGEPEAPVCERLFPGLPSQVGEARRWVRAVTGPASGDIAVLVVSELATNAIMHSASGRPGGKFAVGVQARTSGVLIYVRDQGRDAARDAAGRWAPENGHGYGLRIVASLAVVFGATAAAGGPGGELRDPHDPLAAGRCVWCFLPGEATR